MDSVVRQSMTKTVASKNQPSLQVKPTGTRTARQAQPAIRTLQKSKTLMRKSVRKPVTQPAATIAKPAGGSNAIAARKARAQRIEKSPFVNKYNLRPRQSVTKKTVQLPVKPAPPSNQKTTAKKISAKPTAAKPTSVTTTQKSAAEQLFDKALANTPITTSKRKSTKKPIRKRLRWASSLTAVIMLAGFITYLNLPNLQLQLISNQTGFHAAMPSYQPAGYSINRSIAYEPGKVILNFNSNTDDRSYSLTQEVSRWNSETLQENFLKERNKEYYTAQEGGRTVFIYDDNNATWVNGGIWYQVESTALSSDQLLNIASSL